MKRKYMTSKWIILKEVLFSVCILAMCFGCVYLMNGSAINTRFTVISTMIAPFLGISAIREFDIDCNRKFFIFMVCAFYLIGFLIGQFIDFYYSTSSFGELGRLTVSVFIAGSVFGTIIGIIRLKNHHSGRNKKEVNES